MAMLYREQYDAVITAIDRSAKTITFDVGGREFVYFSNTPSITKLARLGRCRGPNVLAKLVRGSGPNVNQARTDFMPIPIIAYAAPTRTMTLRAAFGHGCYKTNRTMEMRST